MACLPSQQSMWLWSCWKMIELSVKPIFFVNYLQPLDKTVTWSVSYSEVFALTWPQLFFGAIHKVLLCWKTHVSRWRAQMQPSYDLTGGCRGQHMVICSQLTGWALCDNRPDGQRTGKPWLGKQRMTPTNLLSVCPCCLISSLRHSLSLSFWSVLRSGALLLSISILKLSAQEIFFFWIIDLLLGSVALFPLECWVY